MGHNAALENNSVEADTSVVLE